MHLTGKRRRKGTKNKYQERVNGYWTKNFLPFAKKSHLDFIEYSLGLDIFQNNPALLRIKNKVGITLHDYRHLYNQPELQQVWRRFFACKILYR